MKKTIALGTLLFASAATMAVELVPLDMEPGYWETTTEIQESDMMRQLLASVPEAQRAQMRQMMQGSLKQSLGRQCITADSFKDMEKQFRESLGSDGRQQCDFEVVKSTSEEMSGSLTCAGIPTKINTKVINSKLNKSTVISIVPGMGENKVITTSQWKSAECPADLK